MGTSIAMIDLHSGHLAIDSYQHAVSLLDALALERRWTLGGAGRKGARRRGFQASRERLSAGGGRSVDECPTLLDGRPILRRARSDGQSFPIAHNLFDAWEQYQHDSDRARLQAQIAPLQAKLRTLLEHAARKSPRTKYHRDFARSLLKRWPALWTFARTDGVEPTNNHAERGLRGAVIYRKLSLGSQSERGERTIEPLLSASVTSRLRKQSLFAYLTQALTAHARGDPVPTLT
jgi:hypothetical protein